MDAKELRNLQEAYNQVHQLDEALTGERLERAKEIIARDPKSPKAQAVRRVADSQEGSDRGDTKPGDLPSNRNQPGGNTTLPTRRGGRGRKGQGKTVNRPPHGAPLGGRTGESDRGRKAFNKEQVDIYDIILSHLLDEGYAETPEAAEAIMVNMSEDWKNSIIG